MSMLEVKGLQKTYVSRFGGNRVEALKNVNFTVEEGEYVAIMGESGSGKTTLLNLLAALDRPTGGSVLLDGKDLLALTPAQMRKRQGCAISVVFQEPMSAMNPVMRIGPQVEEALRVHTDLSAQERRQRALQALRDVDLPNAEEVYQKYPHQMSGGMLQRAMIAAAIISRPKLLLADEPTTALDVTIQAQILELLLRLNREMGMSILFISHNLNVVRKLCTRVAVMEKGLIVETGDTQQVFYDPRADYTRRLIAAIPTRKKLCEKRY